MNKYPLYNLDEDSFENLVVLLCQKVLGISTVAFAKGKDGGRDGRFEGKANHYPSDNDTWSGKFIIQSKHTTKIDASCSDSDFETTINKEIPKIKKLKSSGEIDYYLVFTNRKYTGEKGEAIRIKIQKESDVACNIIGNETIQLYLQQNPDIVKAAKLNNLLMPLSFDETDIKEVILAISEILKTHKTSGNTDFQKIELSKKNELNKLSQEYFNNVIKPNISEFDTIKRFLSDPINSEINEIYMDASSDLKAKIELHKDEFEGFEAIIEQVYDSIVSSDSVSFRYKKRLIRIVLHYMYCTCDIGRKE